MKQQEPIWTKSFISIFCTNLSIFIVFYGLVATLPLYALDVLSRSDEEAGLLMSIFLLSAIIVRPFTGKLLDIFGKRKMMWLSLVLYLLCTILYYLMHDFQALLVLRFVHGIWFSIITTASGALAADMIPLNRRGAGLGYFAMSTNLGVVLGPFIALFFVQTFSFDMLFIALSVLLVLGSLAALAVPKMEMVSPQPKKKLSLNDFFEGKAMPVAVLGGFFSFTYASVLSYISIYAQGKGLLGLASTFFVVFAAVMLLTRPYTGRIFDEKGPQYIMIPGMVLFFLGLLSLAFMNSGTLFMIAGCFIGLGYGALVPSLQALAIQRTAPERSGYATATFFTFFDLGIALGSYVLGLIAVYFGYQNMYLISGAVVVCILVVYLLLGRKKQVKEEISTK